MRETFIVLYSLDRGVMVVEGSLFFLLGLYGVENWIREVCGGGGGRGVVNKERGKSFILLLRGGDM